MKKDAENAPGFLRRMVDDASSPEVRKFTKKELLEQHMLNSRGNKRACNNRWSVKTATFHMVSMGATRIRQKVRMTLRCPQT